MMITKERAEAAAAFLGLAISASLDDIKATYRAKARDYHPDGGKGSAEAFSALRNARDDLAAWRELQGDVLPSAGCPHCTDGRVEVRTGFRRFTRICPHCRGAG